MRRVKPFLLIALLLVGVQALAADDFFTWLKKNVVDRVRVTGNQTFGLHYNNIEGDQDTYHDQWNYGQNNDTFTDRRNIYLSGDKVLGVLTFDMHLSNDKFRRPQDDKVMLSYEKSGIRTELGDISASLLNTNELIGFRRSMRGGQIEAKVGALKLKGVYTSVRAAARTISIQGNNTSGPYYLQAGYIVEGSISVQVDGIPQKFGVDYVVNVDAGTITFNNKVIPPSSTIVVTYETMGFNQDRGTITGGGLSYDFGKGFTAGLTHIIQDPKLSNALSQTTEEFQGYGPPDTPYFLSSIPLDGYPVVIKVDGILQTEGVDYYFDVNNPMVFYFTRFMPNTSVIRVTYTPTPDAGTFGAGKRTVSGFDLAYKFGKPNKGGTITYALAQSELQTPLGPEEGRAQAVRFDYKTGRSSFGGTWKNIPSNFISIEGVGFNRNEKGGTMMFNYDAGKGWKVGLQGSDATIGTPTFDGQGIKVVTGRTQTLRWKTEWRPTEEQAFYFEAAKQKGEYDTRGSDSFGLTTGWSHKLKRFTYDISALSQNIQAVTFDEQNGKKVTKGDLIGTQASATYDFGKGISWANRIGIMNVKTNADEGTGHVASSTISYTPNEKLDVQLSYADSFSGAVTGIPGFGGGSGYGYNGNGFSGGGFDFGLNSAQSSSKVLSLSARWNPTADITVQTQLAKTQSEGQNLSNSESEVGLVSIAWNPTKKTVVNLDVSQSNTKLLNTTGSSKTTLFGISVDHSFSDRWNASANYTRTDFGGSGLTNFGQNLNSYDFRLNYYPAKNQRAFIEFGNGRTNGYRADLQEYFNVGYSYDILPGVALVASYRIRNQSNFSDDTRNNSYKSAGFDLELQISFRR
ncbi:MAG: hypothetical protein U0R49_10960 [Fimbriimonadales bacterium]